MGTRLAETFGRAKTDFEGNAVERAIGLPAPRLYETLFPIKGSVEEMLDLGSLAGRLYAKIQQIPALELEIRNRLPRETPSELLAACQLYSIGAGLEFRTTDELCCPYHVCAYTSLHEPAGARLRHALVLPQSDSTLVFLPQVPLVVISQSRERRPDFLTVRVKDGKVTWCAIEIDGTYHRETANKDARRAHGLVLPILRYTNAEVLRYDFPTRVVRAVNAL